MVSRGAFPERRRPRRRGDERGAAMFVVLMVLLILSGIGTFAVSNARFELQTSGFARQRYVSQEMSGFGALAAANEVATAPAAYVLKMRTATTTGERCKSNSSLMLVSPPPPCYHLYARDIEYRTNLTTERLIQPPVPASNMPGSLGLHKMGGGFWVELTEPLAVIRPVPGAPIDGSPGTPRFLDVTVTSTGVVWPDENMNAIVDWPLHEGRSAVFTTGRAHVVIGPIYGPL